MWSREFRSGKSGAMYTATGPMQKSGPYPFDIRSLAIWEAETTKNSRDLQEIRISWLKWFHMPDQMPLKYCIISPEWSPDEYQLFGISKVPTNENNSLDQVAESSPWSSDKNLLSWGWEDTGRGNLPLDQLPDSSEACICTILEKRMSTIKGDARAFFWKQVHSSTWLLTHWLQLICIHSVSISWRVYWKAFKPEEFPDKRRKQQNYQQLGAYNKNKKIFYIPIINNYNGTPVAI